MFDTAEGWREGFALFTIGLDRDTFTGVDDHRRKDVGGWQLEPGTGRRRLLPPGHPDLQPSATPTKDDEQMVMSY